MTTEIDIDASMRIAGFPIPVSIGSLVADDKKTAFLKIADRIQLVELNGYHFMCVKDKSVFKDHTQVFDNMIELGKQFNERGTSPDILLNTFTSKVSHASTTNVVPPWSFYLLRVRQKTCQQAYADLVYAVYTRGTKCITKTDSLNEELKTLIIAAKRTFQAHGITIADRTDHKQYRVQPKLLLGMDSTHALKVYKDLADEARIVGNSLLIYPGTEYWVRPSWAGFPAVVVGRMHFFSKSVVNFFNERSPTKNGQTTLNELLSGLLTAWERKSPFVQEFLGEEELFNACAETIAKLYPETFAAIKMALEDPTKSGVRDAILASFRKEYPSNSSVFNKPRKE